MVKTSQAPASTIAGTFAADAEHENASRKVCEHLGGKLSTRPDGSLVCRFTGSGSADVSSRVPGEFAVDETEVAHGREVCRQLGGRFVREGAGGKCLFVLPQEPRWSVCSLSETAGTVRFDPDTVFLCTGTRRGVRVQVLQGGTALEDISLLVLPSKNRLQVESTAVKGRTTRLQLSIADEVISISYACDDRTVFELEVPLVSAEKAFAEHYARHPEAHPDLPYLQLLLEQMQREPSFHALVLQLVGLSTVPPTQAGVVSFCFFACKACLLSLEPHACIAWAFCMGFQSPGFLETPT